MTFVNEKKNKRFRYKNRIEQDLKTLGLPTDFNLVVRESSNYYYGKYNPNTFTVIIYYDDKTDYASLFPHIIHEAVHHWQLNYQPNFVRVKGTMHDSIFKEVCSAKITLWKLLYNEGGEKIETKVCKHV